MNALHNLPLIILYSVLSISYCVSDDQVWKNEIHVNTSMDANHTGCRSQSATKRRAAMETISTRTMCPSLNMALQHLQKVGNYSVIRLPHGTNYSLTPGNETVIRSMSHIAIIGATSSAGHHRNHVIIFCDKNNSTGFSFINSFHITLKNFTIKKCYQFQNSTSLNYTVPSFSYIMIPVSLYMLLCEHVTIMGVTIEMSNATGMILYNVGGTVLISDSSFNKNSYRPGGGGLQIELSYCIPGNYSCVNSTSSQIEQIYSTNIAYTIENCNFTNNTAFRGYGGLRKVTNVGRNSFSLGHGGGLMIVLKGNASNNSLIIKGCHFTDNTAHMGAGFHIAFHDNASNNIVIIRDSLLKGNMVLEKNHAFDVDGGGGGGKVILDNGKYGKSSNNSVSIVRSNFTNNEAIIGGGLWVETNLNDDTTNNDNVSINNCIFSENSAFLGSGIYLSSGFRRKTVKMSTANVNFLFNSPTCSGTIKYSFLPCSGILYSVNIPFSMGGTNTLKSNTASAIEIHEAKITILDNSTFHFENNTSSYGSSIALYDCSKLLLSKNTTLTFTDNKALVIGGAIYAGSCSGGSQPADASSECFIEYFDSTTHPNDWNTSLTFRNNSDEFGNNSIFSVSLAACWWPLENEPFIYTNKNHTNLNQTLCWKPWNYSLDCHEEVSSGPAFMYFETETYNVRPGEHIQLPKVRDGTYRPVTKRLVACVTYGPASFAASAEKEKPCKKQYHDQNLQLYYHGPKEKFYDNHTVHISMKLDKISPGGLFEPSFDLKFGKCEFPFFFNGSLCLYEFGYFCCDDSTPCNSKCSVGSTIIPKPQYCIGNSTEGVVIGHCPVAYNGLPCYNSSAHNIGNLSECGNGHNGVLCGKCKNNWGVPLNSLNYSCVDCSKVHFPGFLLYILLELMPVSLVIIAIIVFNIKLTDGVLMGFVFYCQIISLNFPVWGVYPAWLTNHQISDYFELSRYVTIPYRIFNLDFLTLYPIHTLPICISNHMDPLDAIVFSYIIPLYCLFSLLCLTVWLVMYEHGVSFVVKITRPFHKCLARFWSHLKINPSLMESLASVYILSFTPIASASFKLLHFTTWQSLQDKNKTGIAFFYNAEYEYFGFPHALFGIIAICLLTVFCILPAMFLVLYPYQKFHRFLDLIKIRHQALISFADINTGALCDGSKHTKDFRSFAGVYLLLRLFIMCFYYIPGDYFKTISYLETVTSLVFGGVIMIFRPFKRAFVNFANFTVFALLGSMSGICLTLNYRGRLANFVFIMHLPVILGLCNITYCFRQQIFSACAKAKQRVTIYSNTAAHTRNVYGSVNTQLKETDHYDDDVYDSIDNVDNWPDRLEHPHDYHSDHNADNQFEQNCNLISTTDTKRNSYGSSGQQ